MARVGIVEADDLETLMTDLERRVRVVEDFGATPLERLADRLGASYAGSLLDWTGGG